MNQHVQLTGAGAKASRRALDYYPTPPDATQALLNFIAVPTRVWEPACGDGAMAKVLEANGSVVYATDLREDTGYGIGGVDFLQDCERQSPGIITNPPFALSEQFIRVALTRASFVAMLLKTQYWHAKKRLALFEEHRPAWVLPLTWRPDFMAGERGGAPTMDVAWTVWDASMTGPTIYRPLPRP